MSCFQLIKFKGPETVKKGKGRNVKSGKRKNGKNVEQSEESRSGEGTEEVKREEWTTFEVGKTRFNDEALRQAGECPWPTSPSIQIAENSPTYPLRRGDHLRHARETASL